MTYTISVTRDLTTGEAETIVYAAGSLKLVSFAAREAVGAIKDSEDDFSALIENINGEDTRTVARVSGDADVVSVVVKKKLTKERAASGETETDENSETATEAAPSTGRRGRGAQAEAASE